MYQSAPRSRVARVASAAVRSLPFHSLRAALILLFITGTAVLLLPARSDANQVYKACGKKWAKEAAKLEPDQLSWMSEQRSGKFTGDLDDDGTPDTVAMTNNTCFRSCKVRTHWDQKETTVRIDYGNGKSRVFFWINNLLVEDVKLYPALGRILIVGMDPQGNPFSKWLQYMPAPNPSIVTRIAVVKPVERTPAEEVAPHVRAASEEAEPVIAFQEPE